MQITIDLDLPAIIANAVRAERVQPLVDKAIAEAIKDAIQGATGYNSEFRKAVQAQLTEAMPHGLHIDDVAKFQLVANAAISEAVRGANAQTVQAALAKVIKDLVPDVPTRIKLSELMEAARDGFHKESHESFYAHLELSNHGGGWLYLDSDEDTRDKYSASMRLAFNSAGDVYALRFGGKDITPSTLATPIGRLEGQLMAMYVGRTALDVDMDEGEVESAAEGSYD